MRLLNACDSQERDIRSSVHEYCTVDAASEGLMEDQFQYYECADVEIAGLCWNEGNDRIQREKG